MPEVRDFDVEGIGYRKIKANNTKGAIVRYVCLIDYPGNLRVKFSNQFNFCVKTCRDEYSDKPILHSTSTVNCQRRVQWHVCIKCKIKEF